MSFSVGDIVDFEYAGEQHTGEIVRITGSLLHVQFPRVSVQPEAITARILVVGRKEKEVASHVGEVAPVQERMLQLLKDAMPQPASKGNE